MDALLEIEIIVIFMVVFVIASVAIIAFPYFKGCYDESRHE